MQNTIEKNIVTYYNEYILKVNNYAIAESSNIYGHCNDFINLSSSIKKDAHRVISSKALKLYSNNKIYGIAVDINAITYIFEIFSDATYRVVYVEKYNSNIEEVTYEKYS